MGKIDTQPRCIVACAGWSVPQNVRDLFGPGDSVLARYATRLGGVEINTSFYRPHLPGSYERWAASTPDGFRFAVKVPRTITHEHRLRECDAALDEFLSQVAYLGSKLDCLLLQLPPSLAWQAEEVGLFLRALRERHRGHVALEARHASWFTVDAQALLMAHGIAMVNADPAPCTGATWPVGPAGESDAPKVAYFRLHGSPRMYYSAYEDGFLRALARRLHDVLDDGRSAWVVFDNTASGAAAGNALSLAAMLEKP